MGRITVKVAPVLMNVQNVKPKCKTKMKEIIEKVKVLIIILLFISGCAIKVRIVGSEGIETKVASEHDFCTKLKEVSFKRERITGEKIIVVPPLRNVRVKVTELGWGRVENIEYRAEIYNCR